MPADIIDGKAYAAGLRERIGKAVNDVPAPPCLAVVLVGDDPASRVYVKNKIKFTKATGMRSLEHRLPQTATEGRIIKTVRALNADDSVDGILVQLPLPDGINSDAVIAEIVGKPAAALFLEQNCTVTITHSRTKNIEQVCKSADILIAAVGRPEMIKADWIKDGACVIDVGINRVPNPDRLGKSKLVGDVDFEDAGNVAGSITPVPGGVGPMTIACLLRNTVIAACYRRGWDVPKILNF